MLWKYYTEALFEIYFFHGGEKILKSLKQLRFDQVVADFRMHPFWDTKYYILTDKTVITAV